LRESNVARETEEEEDDEEAVEGWLEEMEAVEGEGDEASEVVAGRAASRDDSSRLRIKIISSKRANFFCTRLAMGCMLDEGRGGGLMLPWLICLMSCSMEAMSCCRRSWSAPHLSNSTLRIDCCITLNAS